MEREEIIIKLFSLELAIGFTDGEIKADAAIETIDAAIRELTPRLMTLAELKEYLKIGQPLNIEGLTMMELFDPVFMEFREEDGYKMHWRLALNMRDWAMSPSFDEGYNRRYRLWTRRPSLEQREATPWKD